MSGIPSECIINPGLPALTVCPFRRLPRCVRLQKRTCSERLIINSKGGTRNLAPGCNCNPELTDYIVSVYDFIQREAVAYFSRNYNFPGKASENILTMRSYAYDLQKQLLRFRSLNFHKKKTQVRIVGSLCGLKIKMLLGQRRYISEEYNLQIDVRVFFSTLLAYVLNSLRLRLAFIKSWILRCRTKFLLSMCMKVAREQPCWASTMKAAWMLPGSLCR